MDITEFKIFGIRFFAEFILKLAEGLRMTDKYCEMCINSEMASE